MCLYETRQIRQASKEIKPPKNNVCRACSSCAYIDHDSRYGPPASWLRSPMNTQLYSLEWVRRPLGCMLCICTTATKGGKHQSTFPRRGKLQKQNRIANSPLRVPSLLWRFFFDRCLSFLFKTVASASASSHAHTHTNTAVRTVSGWKLCLNVKRE